MFETTANQGSSGNLSSNQFVTLFLFYILYLLIINELQRSLAFSMQNIIFWNVKPMFLHPEKHGFRAFQKVKKKAKSLQNAQIINNQRHTQP